MKNAVKTPSLGGNSHDETDTFDFNAAINHFKDRFKRQAKEYKPCICQCPERHAIFWYYFLEVFDITLYLFYAFLASYIGYYKKWP